MLTSIRELLEKNNIEIGESVYKDYAEDILTFPITIGDFVEKKTGEHMPELYSHLFEAKRKEKSYLIEMPGYSECKKRLHEANRLKKGKKKENVEYELSGEEKQKLILERKKLSKNMKEMESEAEKYVEKTVGFNWRKQLFLKYKNTVGIASFHDLITRNSLFEQIKINKLNTMPMFFSGIDELEEAIKEEEEIGIVGGPCLFGIDEVYIKLTLRNGESVSFDCSCGRRCLKEDVSDENLEEFIIRRRDEIENVVIENHKTGVTRQEFDSILFVFAFANALGAKTVIPLPDISYFKYMESDLKGLEDGKREAVMQQFVEECNRISDRYLEIISRIAKDYPNVEYKVLHARDEKLCQEFYEKRKKYIENSSYIQKLTNINDKKEAVIDYITMLALPYYFYGTNHIVQLDSVDETDSGRKCNKIHKGDIKITQILYPEYLSKDGKRTIYNTALEYKDYVLNDDTRKR